MWYSHLPMLMYHILSKQKLATEYFGAQSVNFSLSGSFGTKTVLPRELRH